MANRTLLGDDIIKRLRQQITGSQVEVGCLADMDRTALLLDAIQKQGIIFGNAIGNNKGELYFTVGRSKVAGRDVIG